MKRLISLFFLCSIGILAQSHHYFYAATAPERPSANGTDGSAYPANQGYINVYDMDNGWALAGTINLPTTVQSLRGVSMNVASKALYLPNYGNTNTTTNTTGARLLKLAFNTPTTVQVVYDTKYNLAAIDRGCISPDGATFYGPAGEDVRSGTYATDWYVIRASDGAQIG